MSLGFSEKPNILWSSKRSHALMYWILIINSQPLHKELEVTSSTIQAGLRNEAIICFLIFCIMSHHVMQEPLCEEIHLQKQVCHVIRHVFNNWCHAGAISCETVPSEDSLVFKSLSGYAQVFTVTTLLLFAFVVTMPFASQEKQRVLFLLERKVLFTKAHF